MAFMRRSSCRTVSRHAVLCQCLAAAAESADRFVKLRLTENAATPDDLLRALEQDADELVRRQAKSSLARPRRR